MGKGKIGYVPKDVVNELAQIKLNFNIDKDADAFKRMAEFSYTGRTLFTNLGYAFKTLKENNKRR